MKRSVVQFGIGVLIVALNAAVLELFLPVRAAGDFEAAIQAQGYATVADLGLMLGLLFFRFWVAAGLSLACALFHIWLVGGST